MAKKEVDKNNIMSKNLGRGNILLKSDIIAMLKEINKELSNTQMLLKELMNIIGNASNKDLLVTAAGNSKYGFTDDIEFLINLQLVIKNYEKILSELIKKVDKKLPEHIPVNSSDLNIKMTLALLDIGLTLTEDLPIVISYIIDRYYLKEKTNKPFYKGISSRIQNLLALASKARVLDFKKLVSLIGNLPNMRNITSNEKGELPSNLVVNYLSKNMGISGKTMLAFIANVFNLSRLDRRKTKTHNSYLDNYVGKLGFVGNPIYHIRKILVDRQINSLETMKDRKRLLELKLAKLRAKQSNSNDPRLNEQIKYYEERLEDLESRIEAITGERDNRQKVR